MTGRFLEKSLSALDVDRVLSLWGIFDIKGNLVAFVELAKSNANEGIAVEE